MVDTDTIFIGFRNEPAAETRDVDENTALDMAAHGNVWSIMVKHASQPVRRST